MNCLFPIVFVFKLSIRVVDPFVFFEREIAVFSCSTVSFRSLKEFQNFNWQQNAKV